MAAPLKQGLEYFPYDVDLDQDDKLSMIIGEFGEKGERLYTKMLAWTYRQNGYYFDWREDTQLRFMRRYNYCGFSMSFTNEVVPRFVKWGLFDQSVFDAFQILTSSRIQKTWLDATRKRTGRRIVKNYWLIEVPGGIMAEETQFPAEVMDKEKESKVKESELLLAANAATTSPESSLQTDLENNPECPPPKTKPPKEKPPRQKFVAPQLEEVQQYFLEKMGNPRAPGSWPEDKCRNEAYKMFNHYDGNGWVQGKGKPIVNWKATCNTWIVNCKEGKFSNDQQPKRIPPPVTPLIPEVTELPPPKKELNYLFERFSEDESHVTIKSLEAYHYGLIVGMYQISEERKAEIKQEAAKYLTEKGSQITDDAVTQVAKKMAVLDFFKNHKRLGNETVFS